MLNVADKAQSGGDFVHTLRVILSIKSNWYMGGLPDKNFDEHVLSGLFQSSKKYTLTSDERTEISELLQNYSTAKQGSKTALIYKNLIWGKNEFSNKLNKYFVSKDFKGFLSIENAQTSTREIGVIVSAAKSSGDFMDALSAVLAHKSNLYMLNQTAPVQF